MKSTFWNNGICDFSYSRNTLKFFLADNLAQSCMGLSSKGIIANESSFNSCICACLHFHVQSEPIPVSWEAGGEQVMSRKRKWMEDLPSSQVPARTPSKDEGDNEPEDEVR